MVRALDRQTERGHVLQRLVEETVEFFVAALNLGHNLQPLRHSPGVLGLATLPDAIPGRAKMLLAILERVEQAGVPSLVRLKHDVEAEPPIGGNRLARCTRDCNRHCAVKIPV